MDLDMIPGGRGCNVILLSGCLALGRACSYIKASEKQGLCDWAIIDAGVP